jgi:hypothetical protein
MGSVWQSVGPSPGRRCGFGINQRSHRQRSRKRASARPRRCAAGRLWQSLLTSTRPRAGSAESDPCRRAQPLLPPVDYRRVILCTRSGGPVIEGRRSSVGPGRRGSRHRVCREQATRGDESCGRSGRALVRSAVDRGDLGFTHPISIADAQAALASGDLLAAFDNGVRHHRRGGTRPRDLLLAGVSRRRASLAGPAERSWPVLRTCWPRRFRSHREGRESAEAVCQLAQP